MAKSLNTTGQENEAISFTGTGNPVEAAVRSLAEQKGVRITNFLGGHIVFASKGADLNDHTKLATRSYADFLKLPNVGTPEAIAA